MLATGGDVVFFGTMDGWLKAVDARTGTELWKFHCGSGIVGNPITYRGPDGKGHPKTYRDLVGLVVRGLAEAADPELTEAIGAGLGRTADALVGLIREGQRAGMVRRGVDPTRAAWEWVRWLFGGLLLKPTDAGPAPADDDLPPQPADCLLHGLLKTDV